MDWMLQRPVLDLSLEHKRYLGPNQTSVDAFIDIRPLRFPPLKAVNSSRIFIILIDKSRSMRLEKHLQAAIATAGINGLDEHDHFSLIAFSVVGRQLYPKNGEVAFGNSINKLHALEALAELTPASTTSFYAGLHLALSKALTSGADEAHVLMLTDGLNNTHPNALLELLERLRTLQKIGCIFRVTGVRFGEGDGPRVIDLQHATHPGLGKVHAIADVADLPAVAHRWIKETKAMGLQQMSLYVTPAEGTRIVALRHGHPTIAPLLELGEQLSDGRFRVNLGPWGNEPRELYLKLETEPRELHSVPTTVGHVSLHYQHGRNGELVSRAGPLPIVVEWAKEGAYHQKPLPGLDRVMDDLWYRDEIDQGLAAYVAKDLAKAQEHLTCAVRIARRRGDRLKLDSLSAFLDIDPDTGAVSVKDVSSVRPSVVRDTDASSVGRSEFFDERTEH
jgi:hypothetical protein